MLKAVTCFVNTAELYCNLVAQGVEDCCVKNRMNLLGMYIDTIPRVGNENCLTTEQVSAIIEHINTLCGHPDWGTLTNINPISIPAGYTPIVASSTVEPQAWNTTIGTAPTVITFNQSLGNSGDSWGMTYTAVNQDLETVFVIISDRTASGFTARTYSDENVHFEGSAVLKTT